MMQSHESFAEQLAEVQEAKRALALEAEHSRQAQRLELEGLASSAEELEEALQQVLANEAEKQASIDLAAAQSELLELHAELLMAEAAEDSADDVETDILREAKALEEQREKVLLALRLAKEQVQSYEDCCQQLRSELRVAAEAQSRQTRQELRLGASKQAEHDPNATVLWCRKAPPQEGLQQSSSAPSLR
ncbi:unnamed protein product [Durusdinium trenchii]|uniref:Uncharacterized protein n=1 Tax=Durusdinium trenchii TaxID=1381693 RepID=A0ABP0LMS0_9DINO